MMRHGNEPNPVQGVAKTPDKEMQVSIGEKRVAFIEKHANEIFTNKDFISASEYKKILESVNLEGKGVVIAGAGFPFNKDGVYSPIVEGLRSLPKSTEIIPVDINEMRVESWHHIDHKDEILASINPKIADVTKLPFEDNSLGGYISANMVNEPKDSKEYNEKGFVERMLKEAHRVLSPGGVIILSSFGYYLYKDKDGKVTSNVDDVEKMITPEQIKKLLTDLKFQKIEELVFDEQALKRVAEERLSDNNKFGVVEMGLIYTCGFVAYK